MVKHERKKIITGLLAVIVMLLLINVTGFSQVEKPGPTNTGYTGTLTPATVGTITVDGTVIENVSTGAIKVKANNVTIRNCRIDGNGAYYVIQCSYGYTGLVIEDCEIFNSLSCCVYGSNFIMRRCNLHDTNGDGIKAITDCLVENTWFHHFGKGENAHADGVQSRDGGSNMIFRYNNFDMPKSEPAPYKSNAVFILESDGGQMTNVLIEYNWMNGGNWTIYGSGMPGITVRNNIFGRDYLYGILNGVNNHECNVWEDTGEAIDQCGPIVENPVITPGGGSFFDPVTVSISCATSGAEIRYTLDGSTPLQTSTLYTGSFTITGSTTVSARAYADGMTESSVVSSSFVILSGTNIAEGKTVTESSNDGNVGANVVDGDVSDASRWSASGYPQWVEIDLGSSYNISGINVFTYQSRDYQYIVEASADGTNYAQIIDRSANTSSAQPIADNVAANARYIKMTVSGAATYTGTWVSINEIMVMGESGSPVDPTSVTVSPTSLTLDPGQTSDLTETVLPTNATDKTVTYSSDNTSVATVNITTGLVTAVSAGNATIAVTTNTGGYSATCAVTVNNVIPSVGEYYCDPVSGSMSNDGSQSAPWSSLEDVFSAGKTFVAGDVIYLMDGNHGFPVITTDNTADVAITKAPGHSPVIERISFNNATHWLLTDVEISTNGIQVPTNPPLTHPVYPIIGNSLVQISNNSAYITIDNCYVNSIDDATSWTADDWNYKAWTGVYHQETDHVTISNCYFKNVNFGFHNASGTSVSNTLYSGNVIENFTGDGLRGHGVNTVIEYNTVKNAYSTNGNHIDLVQVVGTTTGLILRGNKFFAWTDPNQPFKIGCQGMGLFDGMYYDFVIENNLVVTDHYHGITLLGAQNCKIINNTVIDLNDNNLWIKIAAHKDGTPSTGNVVRNNLCTAMSNDANIGSVDNNIIMPFADKDNYFTDFAGFDFSLKASAPAIDVGSATDAPSLDINQNVRPAGGGFDVGAYEYNGAVIPVTGFSMTPDNMTLDVEQSGTITPAIAPSNASNQTINWTTSDPLVAVVIDGVVTALGEGTATITGTTVDGGFSDICAVTVNPPTGDYNVALYKNVTATAEDGLNVGGNLVDNNTADESRWSADTYPQSATIDLGMECDLSSIELYTYQSRAYQYIVEASVDGSNFTQIVDRSVNTSTTQPIADVVSTNARYVKLTVTGADGYTGTWVSINEIVVIGTPSSSGAVQVTGVSVSPTSLILEEGQTSDLTETVSPANATDQSVTWNSSNASVATVDANGLVTAISAGNATITVTTNDGSFMATCAVTVNSLGALPSPWTSSDIGAVAATGSATYSGGTFTVEGSGKNIWSTADEFHFVYQQISGDATITARINSLTQVHEWTKGGVMMRDNLNANSINGHTFLAPIASNGSKFSYRTTAGATSSEFDGPDITAPYWLRMERTGNTLTGSVSADGITWTTLGSQTINMSSTYYVGLCVSSLNDGTLATGTFDNVTVSSGSQTIPVTGVSVLPTSLSLEEGQTSGLTETVSPANATDQSVIWSSSNASVATVDANGLVTAVSAGNATITVTTVDGGYTANCAVTITVPVIPVTGVSLSPVSLSLEEGQTSGLTETVSPANATDQSVTWSSSNASVATVDANGLVTAVAAGSATITVTTVDGGYIATCNVTVTVPVIPVTGVSVSPVSLSLEEGQTSGLTETVSPANATDQSVTWSSSNASVATVDANGLVTAISAGNATITVTTVDGGYTANCAVTITVPIIPVTGVSLSPVSLSLEEGQTSGLTETVSPANATDQLVTWSSSNASVATVDANGLVTAISAGNATITVTTNDGGYTATCNVTVTVPVILVTGVSLSPVSLSLEEDQTSDLTETVSPSNATDQSVTWSSSNASVATVDANGLVTAVAAGNATITVTTTDGGYTANCAVTVSAPSITWTELTYDDFESGWGNFKDGGGDCVLYTGGTYAHQGNNAGQIQDNQGNYSTFYYTNSIDLSSYSQLKIEFWFYGLGMDDGHDFFVEYSDDGGSSWQSIAQYIQGASNDFVNGQFYSVTDGGDFNSVIIDANSYNFTSNAKIRFRCDGFQNDDQVYIDEVKVSATTSASSSANITLAEQKLNNGEAVISIYPNPLSGNILNVKVNGYNEANIVIYDLMGKTVYNQSYNMVEQSELSIPVNNLNKGIYIISVNGKQQKLVVE